MLTHKGTISGKTAKEVLAEMRTSGKTAAEIVKERGLEQISDVSAIEDAVRAVLDKNEKQVAQFKAGNEKLLGFFVGQVMKMTKGSANPALVNATLKKLLGAS